jgi:hypothetical protein
MKKSPGDKHRGSSFSMNTPRILGWWPTNQRKIRIDSQWISPCSVVVIVGMMGSSVVDRANGSPASQRGSRSSPRPQQHPRRASSAQRSPTHSTAPGPFAAAARAWRRGEGAWSATGPPTRRASSADCGSESPGPSAVITASHRSSCTTRFAIPPLARIDALLRQLELARVWRRNRHGRRTPCFHPARTVPGRRRRSPGIGRNRPCPNGRRSADRRIPSSRILRHRRIFAVSAG